MTVPITLFQFSGIVVCSFSFLLSNTFTGPGLDPPWQDAGFFFPSSPLLFPIHPIQQPSQLVNKTCRRQSHRSSSLIPQHLNTSHPTTRLRLYSVKFNLIVIPDQRLAPSWSTRVSTGQREIAAPAPIRSVFFLLSVWLGGQSVRAWLSLTKIAHGLLQ